jgi:siroheme synthase
MVAGIGALANAQATSLDAAVRREVIDTIAAQVERIYVDADTGRMIRRQGARASARRCL